MNRHTATPEQFQQVYEAVKSHREVVYLGRDEQDRERFTTQGMLAIETQMMVHAKQLPARMSHGVGQVAQANALAERSLTNEQTVAFTHLTQASALSCLVGYAGTGKSYLLGAAREAWEAQGYRVIGATLSGIAAENLEASSGIESRTLASHLYCWAKGEQRLSARDVLVIDEAGMLVSRQMVQVLDEAAYAHYIQATQGKEMPQAVLEALDNEGEDLTIVLAYIEYDVKEKQIDAGWSHPCILFALA